MRLSQETLDQLSPAVSRFGYDRAKQAVGIVHLGIGAFHRAHQAWYTDAAMDQGCRDWMIAGVSFRSRDAAVMLCPQDGLFTVAERSGEGTAYRLIGSVRNVVPSTGVRPQAPALIAASPTRIVSLTITEKGYCRLPDGKLDQVRAAAPASIYPALIDGLRRRRQAKLGGVTILSCDNLAGNGAQLARLVQDYCGCHDAELGGWIAAECSFPSTMVDRIVPATTSLDLMQIERFLGLRDAAAVVTEPFSQWVIEDRFAAGRPAWEKVGVELVQDVAPYETAKLRMLNGAHSALAYLGLAQGHAFVHEAVADPAIRPLIERLMRQEAAESLSPADGQDLEAYADSLLARFANSQLRHQLSQIAMDGSQKIKQRWLETLACHQREARQCPAILTAVAAWLRHVRGDNGMVDDPMANELRAVWQREGAGGIVDRLFGEGGLMASAWRPSPADREFVIDRIAAPTRA
ncbi:mannitol dehydrogenase family protein [Novosphingobium sp. G106]|uniref:mannitol dehydrogenase family protein n=1 Tax=Novosphingobium sp. G106 TaxID=2849500 RepID=UPI001C2D1377|nr:mannitol dehydrogenase family protein [Novosphingobium sp. G106]MBV1686717.1 mannitol dehydrogenase family protein [Novosphingobium sp. G106]